MPQYVMPLEQQQQQQQPMPAPLMASPQLTGEGEWADCASAPGFAVAEFLEVTPEEKLIEEMPLKRCYSWPLLHGNNSDGTQEHHGADWASEGDLDDNHESASVTMTALESTASSQLHTPVSRSPRQQTTRSGSDSELRSPHGTNGPAPPTTAELSAALEAFRNPTVLPSRVGEVAGEPGVPCVVPVSPGALPAGIPEPSVGGAVPVAAPLEAIPPGGMVSGACITPVTAQGPPPPGHPAPPTLLPPQQEPQQQAAPLSNSPREGSSVIGDAPYSKGRKRYHGVIKNFSEEQGFGFIQSLAIASKYGGDAFLHKLQFKGLSVGDHVTFNVKMNAKGRPQARHVVKTEPKVPVDGGVGAQLNVPGSTPLPVAAPLQPSQQGVPAMAPEFQGAMAPLMPMCPPLSGADWGPSVPQQPLMPAMPLLPQYMYGGC